MVRKKIKKQLKQGVSEQKINEMGNKMVSSRLDVNEYVRRLKAEGAVVKNNGFYQFRSDHWLM